MTVLVTGATGFLGRRVVQELLNHHQSVRCLVHTPGRERVFPGRSVDVQYGNIADPQALTNALQGMEAVIHLAAIIQQRRNATFDQINRQGTANVVAAAREVGGVKHIVLVSAIGATNNPSFRYAHSKWQAEQAVINGGLPYTIIRPSIIFGEGDAFLNSMAALVRVFPVVPVVGMGRNRFQPIATEDAARCIVQALDRDDLKGKTVEIGGPEQPSYNEIVALVAAAMGKKRWRLHVPAWLMRPNVGIMELLLPRPPLTVEQLRMVTVRNVTELEAVEQTFGFTPRPLEGNIDFVKSVGFRDGLAILSGFMPAHIRDH